MFCKYNSQSIALRMAWNPSCLPPARNTPFSARRLPYCVRGFPYSVSWHPYSVSWHPYCIHGYPYCIDEYPYERRRFGGLWSRQNKLYSSFSGSWRSIGLSCFCFSQKRVPRSWYLAVTILLHTCFLCIFAHCKKETENEPNGIGGGKSDMSLIPNLLRISKVFFLRKRYMLEIIQRYATHR